MQTKSIGGKLYVFVSVDDFSRFILTEFLREKFHTPRVITHMCTRLQREKVVSIISVRSDHGKEFQN